MSMTVAQALAKVSHYLDGADAPEGIQIINDAGQYLHTMHPWRWATGQEHEIAGVAGQSEYVLPANVRNVLAFRSTSRSYIDVQQIEWTELLRREQYGSATPGWYTIALRYDAGSSADDVGAEGDGVPALIMKVWPAPSATESITVIYRRGWTELRKHEDIIGIPDWVNPLFEMLLRAFAQGIHEDDVAPLHRRLDEITGNPMGRVAPSALYQNTASRDGLIDIDLGPPRGGAGRQFERVGSSSRVYPGVGTYNPPAR